MILELLDLNKISQAKKPCLIPFAAGLYAGEYPPEEINRLNCTINIYNEIYTCSLKKTDILCTGDLTNRHSFSLAKAMQDYLWEKHIDPDHVLIAEEESCHTGHQIRVMRDFILTQGYDLLIPISNWWHLRRIMRQMKYWYKEIPILPVASPAAGSTLAKIKNALKETILYGMALTIDRDGRHFDYCIKDRKERAAQKP